MRSYNICFEKMGNILSIFSDVYIAKDTFQAESGVFKDCIQKDDSVVTAAVKSEKLKVEVALNFNMDEKLKMKKEHTGLVGPGGIALYKMRNLTTTKEGLVLADLVAKLGTLECEK